MPKLTVKIKSKQKDSLPGEEERGRFRRGEAMIDAGQGTKIRIWVHINGNTLNSEKYAAMQRAKALRDRKLNCKNLYINKKCYERYICHGNHLKPISGKPNK